MCRTKSTRVCGLRRTFTARFAILITSLRWWNEKSRTRSGLRRRPPVDGFEIRLRCSAIAGCRRTRRTSLASFWLRSHRCGLRRIGLRRAGLFGDTRLRGRPEVDPVDVLLLDSQLLVLDHHYEPLVVGFIHGADEGLPRALLYNPELGSSLKFANLVPRILGSESRQGY